MNLINSIITIISTSLFLFFSAPVSLYGQLKAGISKVDITPPIGGLMYGYGARGTNVSTGMHDPLYARALVLENDSVRLAIVTLDLGLFTAENTNRVLQAIPREAGIDHVLLIASHSHSTPRLTDDFPDSENPWIMEAEKKIAMSIVDASKNLQPAKIGVGKGEVREGFNRRVVRTDGSVFMMWRNAERIPTAPIDYDLGVISIIGNEEVIATLVNFACHPVVLGPDNLQFSADYPGALARYVHDAIGGQVMFLPGAQGDINPFEDKQPLHDGGLKQVERLGTVIGIEVVRVLGGITDYDEHPHILVRKEIIPLAHRNDIARQSIAFRAEINSILLGANIALATFPGEFFVEHGLSLKSRSPIKNTFFIGYANDQLRYFPTIKATTEGGYGAVVRTDIEVGAGERLVDRALINLLYLSGRIGAAHR